MGNDKKALIALMDLVLALADYATTPPGHRGKAIDRVHAERRSVEGWRETLHLDLDTVTGRLHAYEIRSRQERATRLRALGEVVADGQAARTAVAATERRMRAWYGLEGLEGDDSRITDGHKCCGGKPDCGCARSVGG